MKKTLSTIFILILLCLTFHNPHSAFAQEPKPEKWLVLSMNPDTQPTQFNLESIDHPGWVILAECTQPKVAAPPIGKLCKREGVEFNCGRFQRLREIGTINNPYLKPTSTSILTQTFTPTITITTSPTPTTTSTPTPRGTYTPIPTYTPFPAVNRPAHYGVSITVKWFAVIAIPLGILGYVFWRIRQRPGRPPIE